MGALAERVRHRCRTEEGVRTITTGDAKTRVALLDGFVVGKLMDDHAVGVRRLAIVDSKLLAVAQGNTPAAVTLHRFHDLGYHLAVVSLDVVDFGVDDDEDA